MIRIKHTTGRLWNASTIAACLSVSLNVPFTARYSINGYPMGYAPEKKREENDFEVFTIFIADTSSGQTILDCSTERSIPGVHPDERDTAIDICNSLHARDLV